MPDLSKMTIEELVWKAHCNGASDQATYADQEMGQHAKLHTRETAKNVTREIISELTRRTEVPKGHVKLDDGRVVKFPQTFVVIADAAIAIPYDCYKVNEFGQLRVTGRPDYYDPHTWYSTKEAALSAKGVEREC